MFHVLYALGIVIIASVAQVDANRAAEQEAQAGPVPEVEEAELPGNEEEG